MEIKEFSEKVSEKIKLKFDENTTVSLLKVNKNNGVILNGLSIHEPEKNISPTIYLEPYYEAYENGVTLSEIISQIVSFYDTYSSSENLDISFFENFDTVKDNICFKLISKKLNEDLLKEIPYYPYLDLAVVFFCFCKSDILGNGTIRISNNHLKLWGVDKEDVLKCALSNTPKMFLPRFTHMAELLGGFILEDGFKDTLFDSKIWVLSNDSNIFGANVMMYPGILKELAEEQDCDFYIIPSSVHELILLPYESKADLEHYKSMVFEVNRTKLLQNEILSDSIYLYQRSTDHVVEL